MKLPGSLYRLPGSEMKYGSDGRRQINSRLFSAWSAREAYGQILPDRDKERTEER